MAPRRRRGGEAHGKVRGAGGIRGPIESLDLSPYVCLAISLSRDGKGVAVASGRGSGRCKTRTARTRDPIIMHLLEKEFFLNDIDVNCRVEIDIHSIESLEFTEF